MVSRKLPDGLPPGWTVNCKVLDSGRKLKYYTDLKSGKKFYSMNEVFRYMRSMNGRSFKSQQLRTCNGQRKPSIVAKNSLEELPAGYTVNCKVLNSGRKLKYYTDLKTGKKFYSMNEVARYIKCKNGKSFTTQKCRKGSMKKYTHGIKKTNPDSGKLPEGWLIELRQYEAGPRTGREYKVYVDKSSGHKCYSRLQVLRYLKKQNDKGHMVRDIKKAMITRSGSHEDKNDSKSKMEEHLDVVECDTRTPNYKKLSRSPQNVSSRALNTSPAKAQKLAAEKTHLKNAADKGTYVLRSFSMSDGQVNGVQTRGSKRRQHSDLENEITSTSKTDLLKDDNISSGIFKMRTTSKNRGSLPSRFSKRLARLEPEVATSVGSVDWAQAPPAKRSERDQIALSLPMIENMNAEGKGYTSLSVTEIDSIMKVENTVSTRSIRDTSSNNTKNVRDGRLCRRFSKRLAGFEPEVAYIPDSSVKGVKGVEKILCTYQSESICGSALSCEQHSVNTEEPLLNKSCSENGVDFQQSLGFRGSAGNTKHKTRPKKENDETKGLAGSELDAVSNSVREGKTRLPPTTSHNVKPATVEACKDGETQQQTPIWHSWSDPCLEFAFKTLTGEISIEDDLQIQSYFQQIKKPAERDASANNSSLGSPEVNPSMDAPQKSCSREQPQVDLNSGSIVGFNWMNFGDPAKIKSGNRK